MTGTLPVWAQILPMPKDRLSDIVQTYEGANVEGVWAPQMHGAPFSTLAAAAAMTDRIKLGSGIAMAFTRSPVETACDAIDLDIISGGRLVLGLGSSSKSHVEQAFGSTYDKPLAHMRDVVSIIRAIVANGYDGDLGRIENSHYALDLSHLRLLAPPVRREIPIYLPAVFEKACRQAGEIADGLLGHPLWTTDWILNEVQTFLKQGLDKAGRERRDFSLNLSIFTAISNDRSEAMEDTRPTVAFYSQSPQYLRYFQAIGFGSEAAAIQDAFVRHDYGAMLAACSDDMVNAIAIVGTADDVRCRIADRARYADAITPCSPHYKLSAEKIAAYNRRIAEFFFQ